MKKLISALFGLSLLITLNVDAVPAFDQASIDKHNADFQTLFNKVSPQLQQSIRNSIDQTLNGNRLLYHETLGLDRFTVRVESWDTPQLNGLGTAPGFTLRDDGGFTIRAPATGSWGISIPNIHIRIQHEHKVCSGFPWPNCTWIELGQTHHYISLALNDLTLQTGMRITGEVSGKINIDNVNEPTVSYSASLSGPTFLGDNVLLGLFDPGFKIKIKNIVFNPGSSINYMVSDKVIQGLGKLAVHPLTPVGGSVHYIYNPLTYNLEETISNIDDKIFEVNMPHGLVYEVISDTPVNDSWMEAFSPGGSGSPGTHSLSLATADSAIWTGHYLAALAYRYKVKQDSQSLAYVDKALKGIEILFAANGNTGLLARFAAPLNSPVGQQINADPPNDQGYGHLERGTQRKIFLLKNDQGVDVEWISHQGTNGISRDQYTGVMLGLRTAYDMVDDQSIKDRINYLTTIALDYLIREDWIITEDRNLTTGGTPTPWATVPYQKITFLTIGNHITGGNYQQQLDDAYGLLNVAWFSSAISSLSPLDGYYKNNLFYANMLSYLAIEKDPARREKMMEGVRIADYYTGHHANAWFNLVRASYDPANKQVYLEQASEIFRLRLFGGHRHLPTEGFQQYVTSSNIAYEDVLFPLDDEPRSIPIEPLYPAIRINGEFVWQRNPYELVTFDSNSGYIEQIGGDLSLIYWMLRAEGYGYDHAQITQPISGSTITSSSVTFQWTPGRYLAGTALYVGTTPGGADIYDSQNYAATEQVISGIPLTGDPIYVRLWSWTDSQSHYVDYVYQTVPSMQIPLLSEITAPTPGSIITSSNVTFNWITGQDVTTHWLYVGTTGPGSSNIHSANTGVLAYENVSGIPLGGGTLYVRLWSWKSGGWDYNDYTYPIQ